MFSARLFLALFAAAMPSIGVAQDNADLGRAIFQDRQLGLCLLCHPDPAASMSPQADLAPPLNNIGARLSAKDIKEHLTSPDKFNPQTIMPAYGRAQGLTNVSRRFVGRPILAPNELDAVVAYLSQLRAP